MYAESAGDPQQRRYPRIHRAGLDVLIGLPPDLGGKEHGLLRAVLADACDADAVADSAALLQEPGVIIGQVRHSTNALPVTIMSQPGIPGILGS